MKLLFDIGNTRMKVSTAEHGKITPTENWLELLHVAENVLVSNVAGPEALPKEVALHRNCKILTWESPEAGLWLKKIPAGLGADRGKLLEDTLCK